MDCQFGCGRKSLVELDSCIPCYKLVHGEQTANKILLLIKKKECSQNEAIFKVERFLLERALNYLKNKLGGEDMLGLTIHLLKCEINLPIQADEYLSKRLVHILEQMYLDDSRRCSRRLLRKMKQVPQDLLVSLNRYYRANPHEDEDLLESFDDELTCLCGRRYGRSSSDEESVTSSEGNREEAIASCSGKAEDKKRKHSPNRASPIAEIPNEENDENEEPPKKRQAQKIEKEPTGMKRLHSTLRLEGEENELEQPSKRRAGETNNDLQETEQLLPSPLQTEIVSPISPASSSQETPEAVAPKRQQCETNQSKKRGRPKKQPCNRVRDDLGRFVRDESKVRHSPRPKVRRRRTELELLMAGLPLRFQS